MYLTIPRDNWGQLTPFAWQAESYPKILRHFAAPDPKPALIRAVTGGGKSKLMAQMLASAYMEPGEVIVITTPTIGLVEQLRETITERLEPPGFTLSESQKVGAFYTHGKDTHTPVIIACTPSVPELAAILAEQGKKCALWLCDEAHRSATPTLMEAVKVLNPKWRIGLTATPWRANESERLNLFEVMLTDFGPGEAQAGGVVVPWRIIPWMGEEATLDDACIEMARLAVGPGLYNAMSISDAEVFATKLEKDGQKSKTIHSKLSRGEIRKRIDELREGKLNSLVHVSMLQEGVDWPWLRWLCLRRPVGSRVRFAQEVGRTLRALLDPATHKPAVGTDGKLLKPEAVIYDPHGLFDEFQLSYEAVLGGEYFTDEELESKLSESEKKEKQLQQAVFDLMRELTSVQAGKKPLSVTPLVGYLREVVTAFDVCHLIERKIASRNWRRLNSTEKQHTALTNLKWATDKKQVPKIHQRALGMLADYGKAMTRGMASDLLSVFMSLASNKKWPDLKVLDRSAEENLAATEKRGNILPNAPPPEPVYIPALKKYVVPGQKKAEAAKTPLLDDLPREQWQGPPPKKGKS